MFVLVGRLRRLELFICFRSISFPFSLQATSLVVSIYSPMASVLVFSWEKLIRYMNTKSSHANKNVKKQSLSSFRLPKPRYRSYSAFEV